MVLVDTSIWISLYRTRSRSLGQRLWQLAAKDEAGVCGQIWVEFLGGFKSTAKRTGYAEQLRAYPWLDTSTQAYKLAADWCALCPGLGAGDTIIAATAFANGASLMTLDRGFQALVPLGLTLTHMQ